MYPLNAAITGSIWLYDYSRAPITGASFATTDAFDTSGTSAVLAVTEVNAETKPGLYVWTFSPTTSRTWTRHIIYNSGGVLREWSDDFTVLPVATDPAALATAIAGIAAMTDVATSTRATPGSYITTGSATATSGAATVYQGDDQVAVASRSLDWSTITADQWPDLTGATILFVGQYRANAAHTVSAAGSVITPTGATKHVRVELSAAQTEALHDGVYEIQVIATTSDGDVVTLVDTTMTVKARKGA